MKGNEMPSPSSRLEELAAKCEQAAGPSDGLDGEIGRATAGPSGNYDYRRYTAFLDAAMTLVPEGWHISHLSEDRYTKRPMLALGRIGDTSGKIAPCEDAETLPLALCAAALRAHAKLKGEGNE